MEVSPKIYAKESIVDTAKVHTLIKVEVCFFKYTYNINVLQCKNVNMNIQRLAVFYESLLRLME